MRRQRNIVPRPLLARAIAQDLDITPWLLAAAVLLMLLAAGCESGNKARTPKVDNTFAADAASGGIMEVQLGQLASQVAASDDVKQLGKHMADDHTKANEELKAAAKRDGVKVPDQMTMAHRTEVARLTKLSGKDFDREYVRAAVKSHEETIAAFEQEAAQGKESQLKAFAVRTLPKLREHLKMAQSLEQKMK
jgi:putative membrane protein